MTVFLIDGHEFKTRKNTKKNIKILVVLERLNLVKHQLVFGI